MSICKVPLGYFGRLLKYNPLLYQLRHKSDFKTSVLPKNRFIISKQNKEKTLENADGIVNNDAKEKRDLLRTKKNAKNSKFSKDTESYEISDYDIKPNKRVTITAPKSVIINPIFDIKNNSDKPIRKPNKIRKKLTGEFFRNPTLANNKFRSNFMKQFKGEILYGLHPIYLSLLENRRQFYGLYIRKGDDKHQDTKQKIMALAAEKQILVKAVEGKEIDTMSGGHVHQGICLDASPLQPEVFSDEDVLQVTEPSVSLYLDSIHDPMNLGAILRSAYFFNVKHIFVAKTCTCKLSPVVSKASSGAMEVLRVRAVQDGPHLLQQAKLRGWQVVGTRLSADQTTRPADLHTFPVHKPVLLVLGNEGRGLSKEISNACDTFLAIEPLQNLHPGIDSLNVSVAAGLMMYQLSNAAHRAKHTQDKKDTQDIPDKKDNQDIPPVQ